MSDWERLTQKWHDGQWVELALAATANVAAVACLTGLALLVLLAGILALDWLGALPCICG